MYAYATSAMEELGYAISDIRSSLNWLIGYAFVLTVMLFFQNWAMLAHLKGIRKALADSNRRAEPAHIPAPPEIPPTPKEFVPAEDPVRTATAEPAAPNLFMRNLVILWFLLVALLFSVFCGLHFA